MKRERTGMQTGRLVSYVCTICLLPLPGSTQQPGVVGVAWHTLGQLTATKVNPFSTARTFWRGHIPIRSTHFSLQLSCSIQTVSPSPPPVLVVPHDKITDVALTTLKNHKHNNYSHETPPKGRKPLLSIYSAVGLPSGKTSDKNCLTSL